MHVKAGMGWKGSIGSDRCLSREGPFDSNAFDRSFQRERQREGCLSEEDTVTGKVLQREGAVGREGGKSIGWIGPDWAYLVTGR